MIRIFTRENSTFDMIKGLISEFNNLIPGDILTAESNHEYIVVTENHAFNVNLERIDSLEWVFDNEKIVEYSRVDKYGNRKLVWNNW